MPLRAGFRVGLRDEAGPKANSWFLPSMGQNDEAVTQARRGREGDPLSTGLNGNWDHEVGVDTLS